MLEIIYALRDCRPKIFLKSGDQLNTVMSNEF